jgi:hypothetical protein
MGPYRLPNDQLIANNWADLTDGTLAHPIDADESGDLPQLAGICGGQEVWTNTRADGTPRTTTDCGGWTSAAVSAESNAGEWTAADSSWTESGCISVTCSTPASIYCFEQ